ncbi:helix-turn-helix domain-containing protein [Priestia endophytica]|jgi:AraC-like DNA-binding protein|uniref:helix-turn-helix transcriptional regulator n=1 Tax=Priestia endophytica TaxID=135735 RepID=UPI000DCA5DB8|nr:helix-turn-helix transcriptional regulator [Priestia endophytica]KAB2494083.1 helix-turn-helix transcriptional regulator [Priestia endophytica]MBG9812626.1 hypothetical protein [Priestia endophytica]RAS78812.1 hypothetical protein A4R27_15290 [Priestia endophytica]RAS81053.1 hypothetical protein A4U60_13835 [Priestia endophytica]
MVICLPNVKNNSYLPSQPEFKSYTEYYVEHREKGLKNEPILIFYQFKVRDIKEKVTVVPDGCIDILISCDERLPGAKVCGNVSKSKCINLIPNTTYFGIRIPYLYHIQKMDYTLKELHDQELPLIELISMDNTIVERIVKEDYFIKRIDIFNKTLRNILLDFHTSSPVEQAIHFLYSTRGNISMNQLANEIGYSTRYLRKQFETHIGISPKLFSKIIRFQCSLNMLLNNNHYTVNDVIYENGYYDQSHLINEFKDFGYITPYKLTGRR